MSTMSSPLSDPGSDPFEAEDYPRSQLQHEFPPAKRQRVDSSMIPRDIPPLTRQQEDAYRSDISSDTEGSVPGSPTARVDTDDDLIYPQVTFCDWDGCPAGDLRDMDRLVEHINASHVENKTKSYTCEWNSCSRKSMPHASGYALRAHMRSHTREKPFYCLLPECDKCFTRSDALAKHMRIVHETEALRPSDPIPKTMQPLLSKSQNRLKVVIKRPGLNGTTPFSPVHSPLNSIDATSLSQNASGLTDLPADLFTEEELALGPKELYRLLRRQVHWAEEESEALQGEFEMIESLRRNEWEEKEVLLDQVIKNEIDWHERRNQVIAALPPPSANTEMRQRLEEGGEGAAVESRDDEANGELKTKLEGGPDQAEAAAVLASLATA